MMRVPAARQRETARRTRTDVAARDAELPASEAPREPRRTPAIARPAMNCWDQDEPNSATHHLGAGGSRAQERAEFKPDEGGEIGPLERERAVHTALDRSAHSAIADDSRRAAAARLKSSGRISHGIRSAERTR